MKRIIREVITLIRIERWLVGDEKPLPSEGNPEPEIEHCIEESIVDGERAVTDDLRVIAQRILESQQWELSADGSFLSKRLHNESQTPKEEE